MSGSKLPIALGLVLALAFASTTRWAGRDFLLPQSMEPDHYLVSQAEFLWEGGHPKAAPVTFLWYPSLLAQVLTLTQAPYDASARRAARSLERELAAASRPVVRMRLLIALLSLLAIPGTFLLARRFLAPGPALLAAAFVATSFLFNLYSNQARPHAAQASLALVAVLFALRLRARPTAASYAYAGIAAALAVGCLQNGKLVLGALALAHLLRERDASSSAHARSFPAGAARLALLIAPILASFLWFGPAFNELQPGRGMARAPFGRMEDGFRRKEPEVVRPLALSDGAIHMGPQQIELEWYDGSGFALIVQLLWWHDPVLLILSALGGLLLLARIARSWRAAGTDRAGARARMASMLATPGARELAIVAAYCVPHLLALGLFSRIFGRFLLPLLPYFACLAALSACELLRLATARLRSGGSRVVLTGAWVLALLALPICATSYRAWLQTRPDTVDLAADWIRSRRDARERPILIEETLTLPLFYDQGALQHCLEVAKQVDSRWLCHQDLFLEPVQPNLGYPIYAVPQVRDVRQQLSELESAVEFVRGFGARYVVLEVSNRTIDPADAFPRRLHEALHASGDPVATFTPMRGRKVDRIWMDYQEGPGRATQEGFIWRTFERVRLGPRVAIYDLGTP